MEARGTGERCRADGLIAGLGAGWTARPPRCRRRLARPGAGTKMAADTLPGPPRPGSTSPASREGGRAGELDAHPAPHPEFGRARRRARPSPSSTGSVSGSGQSRRRRQSSPPAASGRQDLHSTQGDRLRRRWIGTCRGGTESPSNSTPGELEGTAARPRAARRGRAAPQRRRRRRRGRVRGPRDITIAGGRLVFGIFRGAGRVRAGSAKRTVAGLEAHRDTLVSELCRETLRAAGRYDRSGEQDSVLRSERTEIAVLDEGAGDLIADRIRLAGQGSASAREK